MKTSRIFTVVIALLLAIGGAFVTKASSSAVALGDPPVWVKIGNVCIELSCTLVPRPGAALCSSPPVPPPPYYVGFERCLNNITPTSGPIFFRIDL